MSRCLERDFEREPQGAWPTPRRLPRNAASPRNNALHGKEISARPHRDVATLRTLLSSRHWSCSIHQRRRDDTCRSVRKVATSPRSRCREIPVRAASGYSGRVGRCCWHSSASNPLRLRAAMCTSSGEVPLLTPCQVAAAGSSQVRTRCFPAPPPHLPP
jgi:hypothetical protein